MMWEALAVIVPIVSGLYYLIHRQQNARISKIEAKLDGALQRIIEGEKKGDAHDERFNSQTMILKHSNETMEKNTKAVEELRAAVVELRIYIASNVKTRK